MCMCMCIQRTEGGEESLRTRRREKEIERETERLREKEGGRKERVGQKEERKKFFLCYR